jgi:hypothetical protein
VAGKRELDLGRIDANPARGRVVDKDGLAQPQLRRDALSPRLWHLPASEEDCERIAPFVLLIDKDAENVGGWHSM